MQSMNVDYDLLEKQIKTMSRLMYLLDKKNNVTVRQELNEDDIESFEGIFEFLNGIMDEKDPLPDEEQHARGAAIAELLGLKKVHIAFSSNRRYATTWGSKTERGLYGMLERFFQRVLRGQVEAECIRTRLHAAIVKEQIEGRCDRASR